MTEQTVLKGKHNFIMFIFAGPFEVANFVASDSV